MKRLTLEQKALRVIERLVSDALSEDAEYTLCFGRKFSQREAKGMAEKIVKMMGNPIRLLIGAMPKRAGETEHFFCSNDKAKKLLGWVPKTTLDVGLRKTIEWYENNSMTFNNAMLKK